MMRTKTLKEKVNERGEIQIPAEIRKQLNLKSGEEVELKVEAGNVIIRPVRGRKKLKINKEILDKLAMDEELFEPEDS